MTDFDEIHRIANTLDHAGAYGHSVDDGCVLCAAATELRRFATPPEPGVVSIPVIMPPSIPEDSWLNNEDYHRYTPKVADPPTDVPSFLTGFKYLQTSTSGIMAMNGVSPEAAFHIWAAVNHGIAFYRDHPDL